MNVIETIWNFVLTIISILTVASALMILPSSDKKQDEKLKDLEKRIKQLENPNEEKGSPVFRDEPDWLR